MRRHLNVHESRLEDLTKVYDSMTDAEREAHHMTYDRDALSDLIGHFFASDVSYTVFDESGPILMFGVVPQGRNGVLWLVGSKSAYSKRGLEFLRSSFYIANELSEQYDYIGTRIPTSNPKELRWLAFMGFTRSDADAPEGMADFILN